MKNSSESNIPSTKNNLAMLIATFFGAGKIPFAPGTIGSIISFPLTLGMVIIIAIFSAKPLSFIDGNICQILLTINILMFFIGIWSSANYSLYLKTGDPKEIIIDEVVGQNLSIIGVLFFIPYLDFDVKTAFNIIGIDSAHIIYLYLFITFVVFRFFDIKKPWPINYFDKNIKGGLGIMLDDVVASIFTIISVYILIHLSADIIFKFN